MQIPKPDMDDGRHQSNVATDVARFVRNYGVCGNRLRDPQLMSRDRKPD